MEKKTLVEKVKLSQDQFYEEILNPSVDIILIGEDHEDLVHKNNEYKIIEKALSKGKDFRFIIENFDSDLKKEFMEAKGNKTKIRDLYHMLSNSKDYTKQILDTFEWPILNLCLENNIEVYPIDMPGNYLASKELFKKREKYLSEQVSNILNDKKFTIGVFGIFNLRDGIPYANLNIDTKRKEIHQHFVIPDGHSVITDDLKEEGIFKESNIKYLINEKLR